MVSICYINHLGALFTDTGILSSGIQQHAINKNKSVSIKLANFVINHIYPITTLTTLPLLPLLPLLPHYPYYHINPITTLTLLQKEDITILYNINFIVCM